MLVASGATKAIYFIRSKVLYHHQFQRFLLVLYQNHVRWLRWGSALRRFFSQGRNWPSFVSEGPANSQARLGQPGWLGFFCWMKQRTCWTLPLLKRCTGDTVICTHQGFSGFPKMLVTNMWSLHTSQFCMRWRTLSVRKWADMQQPSHFELNCYEKHKEVNKKCKF